LKKASEIIFSQTLEHSIIKDMQQKLLYAYELGNQANLPAELLLLYKLEAAGGLCPVCKKPWQKIIVKERFGEFYYFNPTCRCYPVCKNCGHSMHRAFVMGSQICGCGYNHADNQTEQIEKYGKKYTRR